MRAGSEGIHHLLLAPIYGLDYGIQRLQEFDCVFVISDCLVALLNSLNDTETRMTQQLNCSIDCVLVGDITRHVYADYNPTQVCCAFDRAVRPFKRLNHIQYRLAGSEAFVNALV